MEGTTCLIGCNPTNGNLIQISDLVLKYNREGTDITRKISFGFIVKLFGLWNTKNV